MNDYIKDSMGRNIGLIYEVGTKVHLKELGGSNRDVAIYDKNNDTTWDLKNNRTVHGNQLTRFLN